MGGWARWMWAAQRLLVATTAGFDRLSHLAKIVPEPVEVRQYESHFYDSRGNVSKHELIADGNTITWKGEVTGCRAEFTEIFWKLEIQAD
jgi:hypothetical protein